MFQVSDLQAGRHRRETSNARSSVAHSNSPSPASEVLNSCLDSREVRHAAGAGRVVLEGRHLLQQRGHVAIEHGLAED